MLVRALMWTDDEMNVMAGLTQSQAGNCWRWPKVSQHRISSHQPLAVHLGDPWICTHFKSYPMPSFAFFSKEKWGLKVFPLCFIQKYMKFRRLYLGLYKRVGNYWLQYSSSVETIPINGGDDKIYVLQVDAVWNATRYVGCIWHFLGTWGSQLLDGAWNEGFRSRTATCSQKGNSFLGTHDRWSITVRVMSWGHGKGNGLGPGLSWSFVL